MLSEGRYGVEIITQISAVNTALEAVAVNVLNDHDNHCVAGGLACGDEGWRPRRAASCSTPCTASPTPAENVTALPLAATVLSKLGDALSFSFGMFWEILWALILGFGISAMVQAVVSKREMRRLLPDDAPRSIALAAGLGAASSSCSYAAVALARSLFRKGADFTAAMAFELPPPTW
jgi:uncharacterized membrane protein YraQ (UPF0718 family)